MVSMNLFLNSFKNALVIFKINLEKSFQINTIWTSDIEKYWKRRKFIFNTKNCD